MNKLKLISLALFTMSSFAYAGSQCDNMQIKIENHLSDNLRITKMAAVGGELQPKRIELIAAKQDQIFTLSTNGSTAIEIEMHPGLQLNKTVRLVFSLNDRRLRCDHDDEGSTGGNIPVANDHFNNKVTYTIG